MNILVICHYGLYLNLTASFVHNQAKAYAALGHNVRVIIPVPVGKPLNGRRFGPALVHKREEAVDLYYIRYVSLSNWGADWFNTPSAVACLRIALSKTVNGFQPDVIHAHTLGLDSGIGTWLKRKLNRPLIVTTHGSDTLIPFTKGKTARLKQYTVDADVVVCVSTLLKKRLLECSVSVPMPVILNGFNVQYAESSKEKGLLSMIQVGYLVPRKNADVSIRAHALLRSRYPEMKLKIVGSGSELERFQNLAEELGVKDSVRFYGFLPNAEALAEMATSRFFVMPSVREGFGIVYLEAMASGCVTIGTEGEGIADLIVHGENGFLVPPNDPDAVVRVVEWCLAHPEEADAIAEAGRKAAQALTWEKNAKHYIDLFQQLICKEQEEKS